MENLRTQLLNSGWHQTNTGSLSILIDGYVYDWMLDSGGVFGSLVRWKHGEDDLNGIEKLGVLHSREVAKFVFEHAEQSRSQRVS